MQEGEPVKHSVLSCIKTKNILKNKNMKNCNFNNPRVI